MDQDSCATDDRLLPSALSRHTIYLRNKTLRLCVNTPEPDTSESRKDSKMPHQSTKVECVCKHCGRVFTVFPSTIRRGRGKYCSRPCASYAQPKTLPKPKATLKCEHCGNSFSIYPHQRGRTKFCSKACHNASMVKRMPVPCAYCGEMFLASPLERAKGKHQFCSRRCKDASITFKEMRTCKHCGTMFMSRTDNGLGKYCSKDCKRKGSRTRVTVECQYCAKSFYATPYTLNKGWGKYCSQKCAGLGRRDKNKQHLRTSASYVDWRTAVFRRDDYTCQSCGARGVKIHAHHIQAWNDSPELRFDIGNGVTLCRYCHADQHREGHDPRLAALIIGSLD